MAAFTSAEQVALINRALAEGLTPAAVAERLGVDVTIAHGIALNMPAPVDLSPAARVNYRHRRYQTQ
jgi:hypothetical protein